MGASQSSEDSPQPSDGGGMPSGAERRPSGAERRPSGAERRVSGADAISIASVDSSLHYDIYKKKDLEYLIGNLEKLPASARKLFSMGRLYLLTGSVEAGTGQDFQSLFTPIAGNLATHTQETSLTSPSPEGEPEFTVPNISTPLTSPLPQTHQEGTADLFIPLKKSAPLHNCQTFLQWKAAHSWPALYSLCLTRRTTIYLQPINQFPAFLRTFRLQTSTLSLSFFEALQGFVQIFFSGIEVFVSPPLSISDMRWKVRERTHMITRQRQLCVNDLYPLLQQILPSDGLCTVGVTWTDIFPEGFNFVLGEASKRHQAAVVSFGRFETKGFDPDTHQDVTEVNGRLLWKLFKTVSHEVCHLLGLEHCSFFKCAMNESESVSDALSQPLFLCPVCLRKLQQACQFDVGERYQMLQQFLGHVHHQLPDCACLEESLNWLRQCVDFLNS